MADTEQQDIGAGISEGFDRAWASMEAAVGPDAEAPAPEESAPVVEKGVDQEPQGPQDTGAEDSPSPDGSAAYMRAIGELNRAHVPASHREGKSEADIIAMGETAANDRASRDRDYQQSRTRQRDSSADAADDSGPEGSTDSPDSEDKDEKATPEYIKAASTALIAEYGEEDARAHIAALEANEARLSAMESHFADREQESQLAAVLEKANEVLDGMVQSHPDLSKPESRQQVIDTANQLGEVRSAKYAALPEGERMAALMRDAALLELGPAAGGNAKPRRKAAAASANSNDVPRTPPTGMRENLNEGFDRAWRKNMGSKR